MKFGKLSYWINLVSLNRRQLVLYALIWFACYWLITVLYWLSLSSYGQDVGLPVNWAIARWLAVGHIIFLFIAYYWGTRVMYHTLRDERCLSAG